MSVGDEDGEMTLPSEEFFSLIGRVVRDLGELRHAVIAEALTVPAPEAMKKVLSDIEGVLAHAEEEVGRAATGAGRFGPDPLKYITERMAELRQDIARERAIEVEPTKIARPELARRWFRLIAKRG